MCEPILKSRDELPVLAKERGYEYGAEIGVSVGVNAETILAASSMKIVYLIDPWMDWKTMVGEETFVACMKRLTKFGKRAQFIREKSPRAARYFNGESLDYVYVDGSHSRKGCRADLYAWWPIVKSGGIFAGHDYGKKHPFVKVVVDEFFTKLGLEFQIIEHLYSPSWWITKP